MWRGIIVSCILAKGCANHVTDVMLILKKGRLQSYIQRLFIFQIDHHFIQYCSRLSGKYIDPLREENCFIHIMCDQEDTCASLSPNLQEKLLHHFFGLYIQGTERLIHE